MTFFAFEVLMFLHSLFQDDFLSLTFINKLIEVH